MTDKRLLPIKIWEILYRETDENHPMGTETLRAKLFECGFDCDRRAVYDSIDLLNKNGYEIKKNRKRSYEYFVVDRPFDDAELQILMDAVQAASFITAKKTKEFIAKIADLAGKMRAELMQKSKVEFNTPKSDNEHIYYSVDRIGTAIEQKKQISFLYFDYDIDRSRVYRKEKMRYVVNPLATVFSNDNYYLMCYDDKHDDIGHYRIDRMDEVEISDAPVTETDRRFNLAKHKKQLFNMFNGSDARVTFIADKTLIDHIFDKFGKDIDIARMEDGSVRFTADVKESEAFFGWCCSFGKKLKVIAPKSTVRALKSYAEEIAAQYDRGEQ